MSIGNGRRTVGDTILGLLESPEAGMPVFWLDEAGIFRSTYGELGLELTALDLRSAFQLRLQASDVVSALTGRKYYVEAPELLEPIAEIVQCFGQTINITILQLMQLQNWSVTEDAIRLAQDFSSTYIRWADKVPESALGSNDLTAGLAAAILDAGSTDTVELTIAYLRQLSLDGTAAVSMALSGRAAEERQLIHEVLSSRLGLNEGESFDRDLLRLLIVADYSLTPSGVSLARQQGLSLTEALSRRLVQRLSSETSSLKKLRRAFEDAIAELGIRLDTLPLEELLLLRLFPSSIQLAKDKIRDELATTEPDTVFEILARVKQLAGNGEVLESFNDALEFGRYIEAARKSLLEPRDSAEEYFHVYTKSWYQVDRAYRAAMSSASGNLALALQTHYRQWLRDENVAFSKLLEMRSSWKFEEAQRKVGEGFSDLPTGSAVLVCDALRYELALDVVAPLSRDGSIERGWAVASLPSITEVGMSALLPVKERLSLNVSKTGLEVFVGNRETTAKAPRTTVWQNAGFTVVEPADVSMLLPGLSKIVIFHGAVDGLGEKLQADAYGLFDPLVKQLSHLVRELIKKEYTVHLVADHGFLTLPPAPSSQSLQAATNESDVKKRRYRVTASDPLEEPIISRTASSLGFDGTVTVDFPPAVSIFSAHGALTFLHGGISLQELVIPNFVIRPKLKPARWEVLFPKAIRARLVRVQVRADQPSASDQELEFAIWRGPDLVVKRATTVSAGSKEASITCELPEVIAPGQLRLAVGYPGQVPLREEVTSYEPDR